MGAKSIGLVWIVVKDLNAAVKFYSQVVGLKIAEMNEEWGWAELEGCEGGIRLGIAQQSLKSEEPVKPGQNAVITITVDNIEKTRSEFEKKRATLIGSIEEVPNHVKLQTVKDTEGNVFQLVEVISQKSYSKDEHMSGCCSH